MRSKFVAGCILIAFSPCWSITAFAQQTPTIEVVATFDYPGTGNSTLPQKINDTGDVAGYYVDLAGITRGFIRSRNGSFSPPVVNPNGDGFRTELRGINNDRLACGHYLNANFAHAFFFSGQTFTAFDIAGALNTYIYALNDAGDFGGEFDSSGNPGQAYVSLGGTITVFTVPNASVTSAFDINNAREVAGNYVDSAGVNHGFFRDAVGNLTFPVDFPGSTATIPFGINDQKFIVGRYTDSAGANHGFLFRLPARFLSFDYPGAVFTSFNGINQKGFLCGRYDDGSGFFHGFIARVSQGQN